MATVELDLRVGDTHLAKDCDATTTSLTLGHDSSVAAVIFPTRPFWMVIEPDDPNAREDLLVTAVTGPVVTVRRNHVASPPGTGIAHKAGSPVRLGTRAGAMAELRHAIGATGEPAFTNSWGNAGGVEAAGFWRTPDGMVHVYGGITGGAVATAAFTLPAGYRPSATRNIPALGGGGAVGFLTITNGGVVTPQAIGTGSIFFNFSFVAEA